MGSSRDGLHRSGPAASSATRRMPVARRSRSQLTERRKAGVRRASCVTVLNQRRGLIAPLCDAPVAVIAATASAGLRATGAAGPEPAGASTTIASTVADPAVRTDAGRAATILFFGVLPSLGQR